MNTDFWASRLAAAKRQLYTLPHHHNGSQLDRLSIDDFDVEDEARPDVPCPYCHEEYDIASLCSHLEDEHSSESRVTRRRRLRRVAIPSSQALSLLGRDLREAHLQVLLGSGGGIDQALLMHLMQLQINFFHHLFGTSQQPKQKKFQNLCHPVLRTCVLRKQHQHMLGNQALILL